MDILGELQKEKNKRQVSEKKDILGTLQRQKNESVPGKTTQSGSGYTPVADLNRATNGAGVSSTSGILEQAAREVAATLPEARTPRTTRTYRDGTTRERQDRGAMLRGSIGTRYDTEGSIASGVQRGLGTAAGVGAAAVDALSGLDYLSSNDRKRIENAQKNLKTYIANRDAATNEAERQRWQKLADHAQNEIEAYTKGSEAKQQNAAGLADALRGSQERLFREASEGDYAARAGRALETVEKYGDNTYDDNLAGLIGSNYGVGRLSQNSSYAWNEYLNDPTPENRAIAELYDLALSNTGENNADALTPDNGLETWARSIANYAPQFLDQTAARLKGGAAGLLLGNVSAGQAAGSALDMYAITRGAAFRGLLEAGVPEEQAIKMAKDEALISSIIEYADSLAEYAFMGGKDIVKLLMSGGAELATTTAGKSAGRAAAKKIAAYLANIVQEGEEERSQEAVSIANERRLAGGTTDSGKLGLAQNALDVYWNEGLRGDRESETYQRMAGAAEEGRRVATVFAAIPAGTGYAANRAVNRMSTSRGMDFVSDALDQAERGEVSDLAANRVLNNSFSRDLMQREGGVTLTDDMTKQEQRDAIKQAAARLAGVSEAEPVAVSATNNRTEISEPSTPQRMGESEAREALPLRGVSEQQLDRDLADAARLSVTLGRSGANAFLTAYDRATAASVEPTEAFENFSKVYNAAVRGENAPEVSMPEHLRIAAQGAGENDARTAAQAQYFGENAGLAPNRSGRPRNLSRREARVLDAIGKAAGVQIRFADTMNGANASIENGVLTIAKDADDPVRAAFTHEIVHRVREGAPEAYSTLAQFVVDNMSDERLASAIRARSDVYSDMNYSVSDITEETVADAFGRMASEPELLEKIAGVDRTAAQKILDAIDELLRKIKAALSGKKQAQLTANQIEAFRDLQGRGEEMAKALRTALDKVQEQAQTAANESVATELQKSNTQNGNVRKSLKENVVYNKTALLSESTIDRFLEDYAAKSTPNYAQAYITWLSPEDFINLTTSREGRFVIDNTTKPLDIDKLVDATQYQPFQLRIDHETGEISGHEGRHRANALLRAGVERIPVLMFDSSNKYDKATISELRLKGQDFGSNRSYAEVLAFDLMPLSYANRDRVVKEFATQPSMERMATQYNGTQSVRFSRNVDSEYMAAVERGDMDEAQRMVDEAAEAAGYTVKAYHATDSDFTVFNRLELGKNTDDNATNELLAATAHIGHWFNSTDVSQKIFAKKAIRTALQIENPLYTESLDSLVAWIESNVPTDGTAEEIGNLAYKKMREQGYDGVILNDEELGGTSYVVFNSSQAKSADPVTYDDNGNVIPLSERFNTQNSDIRYSRNVDSEGRELTEAQQDEQTINKLRERVNELTEQLDFAWANDLSETEERRLRNELVKTQAEFDKMIAKERRMTKRTPLVDILENLDAYRRSDLESLAEQISDSAWDDYEELSDNELRDALRDMLTERANDLNELERQAPKYGFDVRPVSKAAQSVGINYDAPSGSANAARFSRRTWEASDYAKDKKKAAQDLSKALGCSVRTATKFINDVNSIAKMIADDRTRLDYEAAPGASSFVSNVEYGGSIDFSTICKKRRLLTGTIEAIQKAMPNGVLTADEVLKIRETMKKRGYEVSCGLCYVEGSRAKMGEFAAEFINLYKKYHPDAEWMPNMYDVNTPTGAENMRVNHPDVYKEYEHFWNHYGTLREGDPNLFASQQKPKLFQAATEYDGEILKKFRNDGTVAEKNKNGGLRLQSFSDFEIIHLIDTMQVIMDMSRVGLAGQAYTKVPDFAWAVGGTGLKVNCSLIAKGVDENGRIILDEVEGMKRADAEALRNAYSKNVGTILVVFNDEQLQAAMNDPFIDFIIPFHRSQWAKRQYEILGLPANVKDYTNYQNEKFLQSGKKGNLMPNEYWDFKKSGKANAKRYLELCAENGKRPKFYNLLVNNGDGSYSLQPDGSTDGYWKLLIDFKMYDNQGKGSPQTPVQPKFNMEQAERMLNEYTGGHEQFPVAQDVVDEFVQEKSEGRRFSRKSVADAEEREAALLQENDLLREEIKYWKAQLERTPAENVGIVDPNAVRKTAKKLIADYGSTMAHGDITNELQDLYNLMGTGSDRRGELSYESAREIADSVARKIAENAVDDTESAYRMYEDLRSFLRTMDLTVTAAETAEIADWGDWRKQNFGRMQVKRGETSNIDRIYDELSDAWPEFFPGDVLTVGDQLNRIAEVADYLYRDRGHNPYDPYMDQAVIDIGNDIMERFFDLPQAKTFADKQAAKIETLRVQMSELRARDSERLQRSLAKVRESRDKQMERMTERFRAKTEEGREKQSAAKLRKQIMRHTSALSQKLLRPTDKQHIPDSLRAPVAAMLEAINKESAYDIVTDENGRNKRVPRGEGDVLTKRTQAFAELKKQYAELKDDENLVIDPDLLGDEATGFQGLFDQVLAMSGTPIQRMSTEQLQTVWKVVRAVEHSVSTYGKTLSAAKFKTTADWAFRFRDDTKDRKDRATIGGKDISLGLENPYTFFSQYGESGKAVFRMLRDAQDTQRRRMDSIADAVHNIADSKTVKELRETRHEFTTERGDTLTLTTAQIMELYNLTKREQAQNHLLKGGVVQPEIPSAGKQKRIERGTEMIRLTQEDLGELAALLTPRQTDIADALQQLTATALAEWGNEASMAAYGYRKFTERNYWPIHTAQEALHSKVENDRSNPRSIKNIGMAKALVPNASNAVSVGDVFTTFAEHAADMIDYSSWLLPMEDANRLFNFKYKGDDGYPASTFKQELDRVGGRNGKAQKYWTDLMADIQNGLDRTSRSDLEGLAARGIGNVKGASVGANLRVVVQQPTAYLRANAVMNPESLTKGLIGGVTRGNGWQKAQQYAAIARIKDVGGFDQGSTRSVSNELYSDRTALEKVGDIAGWPAGKADAVTWGALWNAAEWETKRLHPELADGSAAFYQKAAEIFTDTIDQTQVVDGVLQRSAIMRSGDRLTQQMTAFMGEPIMALNLMLRSYDNVRYAKTKEQRGAAIRQLGRAVVTLAVTDLVNSAVQSLVDALRKDDKDKDYWDRFMTALTGLEGDEKTAAERLKNIYLEGNFADNASLIGRIPLAKDLRSILQGFTVERLDAGAISDLMQSAQQLASGKYAPVYGAYRVAEQAAKIVGIPAANLERDVHAAVRSIIYAIGDPKLLYEYEKAIFNSRSTKNKSRFFDTAYMALEQGDTATYETIRNDLVEKMGVSAKDVDDNMKSRYNKTVKEDEAYKLPQASADLLALRQKYSVKTETEEEKFKAENLGAAAYTRYSNQRARDYKTYKDALEKTPEFRKLSAEDKDRALNWAYSLADEMALEENSDGQYKMTDKWKTTAKDAKRYGISMTNYLTFHMVEETTSSTRDKEGKEVKGQKKADKLRDWLENRRGLTDGQRAWLWGTIYSSEW